MNVRLFCTLFLLLSAFHVFGEEDIYSNVEIKVVDPDPLGHQAMEELADELLDEYFYEENEMYLRSTFDYDDSDEDYGEYKDEGESQAVEPTTISQADDLASKIISKIPIDSLKKGLNQYRAIVDAKSFKTNREVGDKNTGIAAHMENMVSGNPCFAAMVEQFYGEINELDQKYENAYDNRILKRPSQSDFSGKGMFKDLKAGWLWDKALKSAKGNTNIAARILGVCGHDDIEQGEFDYRKTLTTEKEKEEFFDRYTESVRKTVAYQVASGENPSDFMKIELATYMLDRKRFKEIDKVKADIECPKQGSVMYLSKALGGNVDIPDDVRERIVRAQAPTKGGTALPSKNYHIYGALYMACRMAEEGMSPLVASKLQKTAAWTYRTIRMDKVINDGLGAKDSLEKLVTPYRKHVGKPKLALDRALAAVLNDAKKKCETDSWAEIELYPGLYCHNLTGTFAPILVEKDEVFDAFKHANKMVAKVDAAQLLENAGIGGGKIPFTDFKIPHTNIMVRKPKMVEIRPYHWPGYGLMNYTPASVPVGKPKGWSTARFQRALDKMETYLVDWDWTTEQHGVGAAFGSTECEPMEVGDKVDDIACDILNSSDQNCGAPKNVGVMSRFFKALNKKLLLD